MSKLSSRLLAAIVVNLAVIFSGEFQSCEDIPAGKINAQLRSTVSQLEKVVAERLA